MARAAICNSGDVARYGGAKNILIMHNRFEHRDARISVGAYPRKEYPVLLRDLRVEDHEFVGMKGPVCLTTSRRMRRVR